MIVLLLAFLLGSLSGIVTGISPGIHVNLASAILASSAERLSGIFTSLDLAVFIVAMATVHTFLDVIPSVFLGTPSEGYAVAVLPGHRLLLAGMGYEAVRIATAGAVLSGIISIMISPLLWFAVPLVNSAVSPWMAEILIISTAFLILREKGWKKKAPAAVAVLLSGLLGWIVLNRLYLSEPLLPMLSGLFGASTLILSFGDTNTMPSQFITENISIPKARQALLTACAVISGWLVSLLPGVGSAQAAILSTAILPSLLPQEYLYLVGGIGTVNFVLSIISMATIDKARNGAIAAVMEILPSYDFSSIIILMGASLAAIGFGAIAALLAARVAVRIFKSLPYTACCAAVLITVSLFVLFRSGLIGFIVFISSTAIGIFSTSQGTARIHLMACLTVPVVARMW